ncbi:MAG: hypothetical protein CMP21_01870 [Rickettsiales bacterium]|nr:hypothetical protein [Rickettsiales bacterium]
MNTLKDFTGKLVISKKSYFIMSGYLSLALIMATICFFPFISEISYRNAYFLAEQGKVQNYRYINRFNYAFFEYEKAIRYFPLESHYASEYIKSLDSYIDNINDKKQKVYFLNKAINLMSYIQVIDPINPWYHARISALYLKLFFHTEDKPLLKQSTYHARQALLSDYENPIFILNFATILQRNKRFSEAFYYYEKVISIDDRIPEAHFNIANIYSYFNKFHYALNSYLKAKELKPNFQYIDAVIIQTYMFLKEFKKAEQYINLYELFYSKEDKTLDIVSLFYFNQDKFLLSISYLDLFLSLSQFDSHSPDNSIFDRYILCLKKSNQTNKISSFIASQINNYPDNSYLKSLQ